MSSVVVVVEDRVVVEVEVEVEVVGEVMMEEIFFFGRTRGCSMSLSEISFLSLTLSLSRCWRR